MNIGKPLNIFIVDDNKVFALALKADIETSFSDMPVKISIFETGETCMDEFKNIKPQVVILDYHLNRKYSDAANGIKVLDWIKDSNPATHVIILTNDDNIDIALKSFRHGASDYVVKTETKFRKINYSLFLLFKILEGKREKKVYQNMVYGLAISIALLLGSVLAIQIFAPSLLR